MKDSKPSSPGALSPQSPQTSQHKRSMLRLRRLLHAMETNEVPSGASWRSISSRAQLAQDLWRQVQEEMEAEEEDVHWLQDQVDEACQKAHQFARQRFQEEATEPDLIQTVFFAPPEVEVPRSRATSRDMDEDDPEMGVSDDEETVETAVHHRHNHNAFLAPPLTSPKMSNEDLQRAQREQIEEAIAQMASQMKEETQRIHATLQGQTQELNTMEDLATLNVQKVGQVAYDVKSHVQTGWRRSVSTWFTLIVIFAVFVACMSVMQIFPKRKDACLWYGCERPVLPRLATNTYSLVQTVTTTVSAKLSAAVVVEPERQNQAPLASQPQGQLTKVAYPSVQDVSGHKTCEISATGECVPVFHKALDDHATKSAESNKLHDSNGVPFVGHHAETEQAHVHHEEAAAPDCTQHSILFSAQQGHLGELKRCLSLHPEWINQVDENQWSAIHEATHAGWLDVVEYLVNAGASLRGVTNAGLSPLELARNEHGEENVITKFLEQHQQHQEVESHQHHEVESHQNHEVETHQHHEVETHQHHEVETHQHHEVESHHAPATEELRHEESHQDNEVTHWTEHTKNQHEEAQHEHHHHQVQEPQAPSADMHQNLHAEATPADNCARADFQWMAHFGKIEELQRCLSLHPDWVNTVYDHGWTALHEASRGGHADVVVQLLNAGANADLRTNSEHTALELATQHLGEHHAVTQILLDHRKSQQHSVDDSTQLQAGGDAQVPHHEQHEEIATTHSEDNSPSATTADVERNNAEHTAASCQPDQIHWMAHFGNFEELQRCLPLHLDYLNRADTHGWTPLHEASRAGHTQVVEYLLRSGANVDARTNFGLSALDLATQFLDQNHAVTQLLHNHINQQHASHASHATEPVQNNQQVENVPNPQEANSPDDCPLYDFLWYASVGQLEDVKRCISRHPSFLNQGDENGWTAIHESSRGGHIPTLEYLLQAGVVVNVMTNLGRTPLDLAKQTHGEDHVVTRMIEAALAQQSHP